MGAKFHPIPCALDSFAAIRAVRSNKSSSNAPASAMAMGYTVRSPWITSKPMISGIPRRLSSTAIFCSSLAFTGSSPIIAPTSPARMSSSWKSRVAVDMIFWNSSWEILPSVIISISSSKGTSKPPTIDGDSRFICPIFSSSVIRDNNSSTRFFCCSVNFISHLLLSF